MLAKSWNGAPKVNDISYLLSGSVMYSGNIPSGNLLISSQKTATSMTLNYGSYYGSMAAGFALRTQDFGGGVNLFIHDAVPAGVRDVYSYVANGTIDDLGGTLRLNLQGAAMTNRGGMHAHSGSEFDMLVQNSSVVNYGSLGSLGDGAGYSNLKVTLGNANLTNYGLLEATGARTQLGISQYVAPTGSFANGNLVNYGVIRSSVGGVVFVDAPVVGTGLLQTNGGVIKISKSVGSGETVDLKSGVLEFGSPNLMGKPAMQFLGNISNFSAASTILIDGAFGTSVSLTRIAASMSDLKVFAGKVVIGDFHLAGGFGVPNGTFSAIGHHQSGGPVNDYASVTFKPAVMYH